MKTKKKTKTVQKSARSIVIDGSRVKALREDDSRKWSQFRLCSEIRRHGGSATPPQISSLENGGSDVRAFTLRALCLALDCSADYLLGLSDSVRGKIPARA